MASAPEKTKLPKPPAAAGKTGRAASSGTTAVVKREAPLSLVPSPTTAVQTVAPPQATSALADQVKMGGGTSRAQLMKTAQGRLGNQRVAALTAPKKVAATTAKGAGSAGKPTDKKAAVKTPVTTAIAAVLKAATEAKSKKNKNDPVEGKAKETTAPVGAQQAVPQPGVEGPAVALKEAGGDAVGGVPVPKMPVKKKQSVKASSASVAGINAMVDGGASSIASKLPTIGNKTAAAMQQDDKSSAAKAPVLRVTMEGAPPGASAKVPPASSAPPPASPKAAKGKKGDAKTPEPPAVGGIYQPAPSGKVPNVGAINTNAGPAPKFQAKGASNPKQMVGEVAGSQETASTHEEALSSEIAANQSGLKIQPVAVDKSAAVEVPATNMTPVKGGDKETAYYAGVDVPENVRGLADQSMQAGLDASLAAPQKKLNDASAQRETKLSKAYQENKTAADKASADAEAKQSEAVAKGRSDVETEKQKGEAQSKATLDKFNAQASEKHKAASDDASNKIKTEQQRANQAITDGNKKAEQKRAEGQAEAAKKKKEAEEKKKHRSFWQKIGDFFSKIFKALAKAVTKIFSVVMKAVNAVLTAAKKLATGIISALQKAITGLIKVFATALKALLTVALAAFPGIRKAVLSAIDTAVNAAIKVVNIVAKGLSDTLSSLIDNFQKAVNFIGNAFSALVEGGLLMLAALATGNFLEAAKIMFKAICKAAGLPADAMLEILSNAKDALIDILKHPIRFLKNLIKATGKGFEQFGKRFMYWFKKGFFGWLFGAIESAGIELPKTFTLKSIFKFILQLTGFTFEYVRERATQMVGERNMEILEGVIEDIKLLFTEGFAAMWAKIKEQAGMIKDMIIQQVSQWLITKIVVAATTKLASLFTPASAIVQAVITMYNMLMFFIERAKQIMQLVASISKAMKTIALGVLQPAANKVETSLGDSIPVLLAFFMARFLGIGGLSEKIQAILEKLRAPVNKIVDTIVGGLISGAKKAWGAAKKGAKGLMNRGGKEPSAKEIAKMPPEERKARAKNIIEGKIKGKVEADNLQKQFAAVGQKYNVKIAYEKGEKGEFKIAYRASPAEFTIIEPGKASVTKKEEAQTGGAKPDGFKNVTGTTGLPTPRGVLKSYFGAGNIKEMYGDRDTADRPKSVSADITEDTIGEDREAAAGSGVATYVGGIGDDEYYLLTGKGAKSFVGGHMIGFTQLGANANIPLNIAPQETRFNHPVYFTAFEARVKDFVEDESVYVTMTVVVEYADELYAVDQKTLIDLGVLTANAGDADGYYKDKPWAVKIPRRIPITWKATGTVDPLSAKEIPEKDFDAGSQVTQTARTVAQFDEDGLISADPAGNVTWTSTGLTKLGGALKLEKSQNINYTAVQTMAPRAININPEPGGFSQDATTSVTNGANKGLAKKDSPGVIGADDRPSSVRNARSVWAFLGGNKLILNSSSEADIKEALKIIFPGQTAGQINTMAANWVVGRAAAQATRYSTVGDEMAAGSGLTATVIADGLARTGKVSLGPRPPLPVVVVDSDDDDSPSGGDDDMSGGTGGSGPAFGPPPPPPSGSSGSMSPDDDDEVLPTASPPGGTGSSLSFGPPPPSGFSFGPSSGAAGASSMFADDGDDEFSSSDDGELSSSEDDEPAAAVPKNKTKRKRKPKKPKSAMAMDDGELSGDSSGSSSANPKGKKKKKFDKFSGKKGGSG